jgi:uncharacterized protein YigE (DUF2233 family)
MAIRFALSAILLLSSVSGCGDRNTSAKTGSQGLSLDRIVANGNSYVVARIDLRCAKLSLAWKDSKGNGYRSFDSLIRSRPHLVEFATNAGIFDPTHTRGWHVEDGKVLISLNVGEGEGNFYLKPNGVFLIDDKGARVLATQDAARLNNVSVATQSGPLLLQGGRIHPKFTPGSSNKAIRSGVGVLSPTKICFVISEQPVSFHDFASFFKNNLGCQDALYLDGAISKFYAPQLGLTDGSGDFAGMFYVVKDAR